MHSFTYSNYLCSYIQWKINILDIATVIPSLERNVYFGRKSKKDRQCNDQMKTDKRTNDNLQTFHRKLKIEQHEPH
jgi:hypothetical protein